MNFKELCQNITENACVLSIRKTEDGYGEIRIVDGNDKYISSFDNSDKKLVLNSIYTDYLDRNLNFEEYCYRSAVKKELLHSYAYPEHLKAWLHMIFIPLSYETEELAYCLYIMEVSSVFNPENLANSASDMDKEILKATLQLANAEDFKKSLKEVTKEVRKICNAKFCCILLVDELKKEIDVLAEDRDLNSDRLTMKEYMDDDFYDIVMSWNDTIANSNCIIIDSERGMEYLKDTNVKWYNSLKKNNVKSLVLFRLKSGNNQIGYMWVSNFESDNSTKIKEALEITTFVLGSEIGNYLLVNKLTTLSSMDLLTGLYNRNKMNNYIEKISKIKETIGVVFLDINGLKKVNDNEGHIAGDNLIKKAAFVLKNVFKDRLIFRAGGDEFVVVMADIAEDEILKYLDELNKLASKNNVSFAYGYAITNDSNKIYKAIKEADAKMYDNKRDFYKSL